MSEGQRQQQRHHCIESNSENKTSQTTNPEHSTGHRLSNRRARAGALLVHVYEEPKGGISPYKVLFQWTKQLVSFRIPSLSIIGFSEFFAHPQSLSFSTLSHHITSQVKSIEKDKKTTSSTKDALDLIEAIKFATSKGPVDWDEELVSQVVDILQTHPVSH
jgi:hypothetical protein